MVSWRQTWIETGKAETSVATLAPVVVKPDMPSNMASTGRPSCGSPDSRYGAAP